MRVGRGGGERENQTSNKARQGGEKEKNNFVQLSELPSCHQLRKKVLFY